MTELSNKFESKTFDGDEYWKCKISRYYDVFAI